MYTDISTLSLLNIGRIVIKPDPLLNVMNFKLFRFRYGQHFSLVQIGSGLERILIGVLESMDRWTDY